MRTPTPPPFFVSIHDFMPLHAESLESIVEAVSARVGSRWHAAVPARGWMQDRAAGRIARCCEASGEILLHGWSHRRPIAGPFSWLVEGCDEFAGAPEPRLIRRLARGRAMLEAETGRPVRGLAPPAWRMGNLSPGGLREAGLDYATTYWNAAGAGRRGLALHTWSWDCGRFGWAGTAGSLCGALSTFCRKANPHVVFHPRDARRGFLRAGLRRIDRLLEIGFVPSLFGETLDSVPQA
jgi:peptidoglycan/xylan/chitin deacetylase (PgdA/CDA1 family)